MADNGMEDGVAQGYDRLANVLAELRAGTTSRSKNSMPDRSQAASGQKRIA
jgi:hypothetical protein